MKYNPRRTVSDTYEVVARLNLETGAYDVLLPGGIVHRTEQERPAAAAVEALRWFTGLDADEVHEGDLDYLGTFADASHYRFTV